LTVTFERTPDILADLSGKRGRASRPILVGFAAETQDVLARARRKLDTKKLDLIVANDVSRADAGFDVDTNAVTIIGSDRVDEVPVQAKRLVAAAILDRLEALLAVPVS
jgi:phosphopantothenoylcysteine decarboxylase/phosphopantothenate--cysteine ligase